METENKVKKKTAQWRLQTYKNELEKAKEQVTYWEELINKEQNYISRLNTMEENNNNSIGDNNND